MATALSNLLALLSLDDSAFRKGLKGALKEGDDFGAKFAKMGGAIALGAWGAAAGAITGIGLAAWNAGNTVDEAYDRIEVKTGDLGFAQEILREDFKAVFASIPTDAGTAAEVLGTLASQLTIAGPPLQELTKNVLEFSRLTKTDAAANAALFGQIISTWKIPAEDAGKSLDAIFVAAQATGVPVDQLMQSMQTSAPVLQQYGLGFNQATALMAQMYAAGLDDTTMMVGLRSAAADFAKTNTPLGEGLSNTIQQLEKATDPTWALNKAIDVFGTKAGPLMLQAIRAGKLDFADLANILDNSKGKILATADATADWGEKWQKFRNQLTLALEPIGAKMMDAVSRGMDAVVAIFNRPDVQAVLKQFTEWIGTAITTAVSYIPILIDGFFQIVTFLQNNQGVVIGILAALGVAVGVWVYTTVLPALGALIVAFGPILLVMAAVGALAYLLYQAWTTNWGGIQEKTAAVIAWITTAFQSVMDVLTAIWNNPTLQLAVQTLLVNIKLIVGAFQAALSGDWTRFGEMLRMVWDNAWRMIGIILQQAWTTIITIVGSLITSIIDKVKNTNWLDVGKKIVEGIANGITAARDWAIKAIMGLAKAIIDAIKGFLGIKSPSKLFEQQVGLQMALGVVAGWQKGLNLLAPAMSATLALQPAGPGAVALPAAGVAVETGGGAAGSDEQAVMIREVYRMLRDLPTTIARANRDAFEKARRAD